MFKGKKIRSSRYSPDLQKLLNETPLLECENKQLYDELREAIEERLDPQDFFEELDVRDLVNHIWEGRRFETQAAELVNAQWPNAIRKLAAERSLSDEMAERLQLTEDNIPSSTIGLGILLSTIGATKGLVQAHALLLAGRDYSTLDKLAANRSAKRKTAVKDFESRRRQGKKDKRTAVKAKQERTKLANDNHPVRPVADEDWGEPWPVKNK